MEIKQEKSTKFVDRLKKARETAGLTQASLAFACNVSKQTEWRWETGQAEPNVLQLHLIASTCGVGAGWLVTGSGDMLYHAEPSERELKDTIAWQANRIRELEGERAAVRAAGESGTAADAEAVSRAGRADRAAVGRKRRATAR
jgi:transcriptional regulator with XRE-family HTH domain